MHSQRKEEEREEERKEGHCHADVMDNNKFT
jgi:hypothetical protein